jgi:hypothetical protein
LGQSYYWQGCKGIAEDSITEHWGKLVNIANEDDSRAMGQSFDKLEPEVQP